MTTARERALERVRQIVLNGLRAWPARVYLFGSSATGSARGHSDIDVAVEPLGPLPPAVLAEVREALEESDVPYDVDLVDLRAASPAMRERAIRDGVVWSA